jgi:heme/copper-type cytochrome/quinol oxidase subunit 2
MGIASEGFDELWNHYEMWSIIVGAFTFIWLAHHSLVYRSKDVDDDWKDVDGIKVGVFPKHNDNIKLELAWTIIPFILIVWLTYYSWGPINDVWADPNDPDSQYGLECEYDAEGNKTTDKCYHQFSISGQQWFWEFDCHELRSDLCDASEYQDLNGTMVPVLSLKQGEFYFVNLISEDVTHAPWFVKLGVKEDTVPGLETSMWVIPTCESSNCNGESGESTLILCTEYCGDNHAYMSAILTIHT